MCVHEHVYEEPVNSCTTGQAQASEDKCKELRDEVKEARDEIDRLNSVLADMAPRAEINAAKKVCAHARTHARMCARVCLCL
jgi:hypothetical protein